MREETAVLDSLTELGFEKIKRRSGGYLALCKFHDDRNPSFSINDTGLWLCFACGVKGNLSQLHDRLGSDYGWRDRKRFLMNMVKPRKDPKMKLKVPLPQSYRRFSSENEVPPYLSKRLQWETIKTHKLGACDSGRYAGRIILPVEFKDDAVGFLARDYTGNAEIKYLNPAGFQIKNFVYNYDHVQESQPLIIVEGAFNALSMWEKGFPNVIAMFGTKFTPKQVGLIAELDPSEVTICFDRDKRTRAGQKATIALGQELDQWFQTFVMPLPYDKDPNDLHEDMLQACFQKRIRFENLKRGKNGS